MHYFEIAPPVGRGTLAPDAPPPRRLREYQKEVWSQKSRPNFGLFDRVKIRGEYVGKMTESILPVWPRTRRLI